MVSIRAFCFRMMACFGVIAPLLSPANAGSAPPAAASRETIACPFDTGRALLPVECGRLRVPENYDNPGRLIEIAFMIVRAENNRDPERPVIFLSGGPGAPSLVYAEMLVASAQIHEVVVDRDWVFFDQRGTGRSSPALHCPPAEDYLERVRQCRDQLLAQGVDLSQYNSKRSAQDIEALRRALGVAQWSVWGVSYGSRLAFAVARDFPASVRAIIHDAPSDPEAPEIVDDFRGAEAAIDRLLAKCAADAVCAAKYPGLKARFLAALPRLRRRPLALGDAQVDDTRLVTFIRGHLFGGDPAFFEKRVQNLLAYMDAAARGDGGAMLRIEQGMPEERGNEPPVPVEGRWVMGHNLSVECHEERAFETMEDYRAAAAKSDIVRALFGSRGGADFFEDCALWPSGRADPVQKARVAYDGPQLAFTGELDASLSGLSGDRIERTYPNARNVVFKNAAHGQADLADFPPASVSEYRRCALKLARQFLADPKGPLDTSCAVARRLRLAP